MNIINSTKYSVETTQTFDGNWEPNALVVIKASYDFPKENDQELTLSEEQCQIMDTDIDEGEPGFSTPFFENNWSFLKPKCDVVLKATAYPPKGYDKDILPVGFKVANRQKMAWVQGQQVWQKNSYGKMALSKKQPLASTPITYSRTYGGSWIANDDQPEEFNAYFLENPVGSGFAESQHLDFLDGKAAPCIFPENTDFKANKKFKPISFGPIGRHWTPRSQYAGTYDQNWLDNVFPKWPADFDSRYFQCAPEDQQIDYPNGSEVIELHNMHPERPFISFKLPHNLKIPMVALLESREVKQIISKVDTIEIDADAQKINLVWRGALPLKRSVREVEMLALGKVCKRWWRSQVFGIGDCGCGGVETDEEDLVVVTEAMQS